MNRPELNEKAREAGVENPETLDTKADVIAAMQAAESVQITEGAQVLKLPDGSYRITAIEKTKPAELPILLRQAADAAERDLLAVAA